MIMSDGLYIFYLILKMVINLVLPASVLLLKAKFPCPSRFLLR